MISLDRSVKDIRHPNCKTRKYIEKLPNVAVIFPFHNEVRIRLLFLPCIVLFLAQQHSTSICLVDYTSFAQRTSEANYSGRRREYETVLETTTKRLSEGGKN
jgi:hypothetical protein